MTPASDAARLGFDPARLARLSAWMQRYVDRGLIPGAATLIMRRGQEAWFGCAGMADPETGRGWQRDTIVRFYSMTKPATAAALMMLYEEALVHLDDPVEAILPEFKDLQVLVPGYTDLSQVAPARTKPTVKHLLTHLSGLSYGIQAGPLGAAYAKDGLGVKFDYGGLDKMVKAIAALPLESEPGTRWHYSVASDVIGRIVEVVSGETLDRFFASRILEPLGMKETGFTISKRHLGRFASLYAAKPGGGMTLAEPSGKPGQLEGKVDTFLGGAGLVGTLDDYARFAEALRAGGIHRGHRLLGTRTLDLMRRNHLPGDIAAMGPASWAETSFHGVGFGLAGSVLLDPAKADASGSPGDYGWGGMAGTFFWVSPKEDMTVVFLTQLMPSSALPLRKELRALVHQALVD